MVRIGIGAHPAGVGALVPLVRPLVVLRERRADDRLAVREALDGKLLADELLLDDGCAALRDAFLGVFHPVVERGQMLPAQAHALAAAQALVLDDVLAQVADEVPQAVGGAEDPVLRVAGDVVFFEKAAREGFGCLQSCAGFRRPDGRDSGLGHLVHEPLFQRSLGADDGEVDAHRLGVLDDLRDVRLGDVAHVLGQPRQPGVAVLHRAADRGSAIGQRLRDAVLPGPPADDQRLHGTWNAAGGIKGFGAQVVYSRTRIQCSLT